MSNTEHIARSRIRWIHRQLLAVHGGSDSCSYASRGREREAFIDLFLRNCLPPQFRFGSGDIVDHSGSRTGQLDVVIELPFFPSLPLVGGTRERLYLAEGVGAVIEVKSNLVNQWNEVVVTASKVADLKLLGGSSTGLATSRFRKGKLPLVAVGFEGWERQETVEENLSESQIDAVLQLKPPLFITASGRCENDRFAWSGEEVLGIALVHLCAHLTSLSAKSSDIRKYFEDD